VKPGSLAAGEYPGAGDEARTREKLERFRAVGVNAFLDLTEAGEYGLEAYDHLVEGWATHTRRPIRDLTCPTDEGMSAILDEVDATLDAGRVLYVHCWGGIGRTGTVVACWLIRHGLGPDEALASIAEWRRGTPDGYRASPETDEQRELVRAWSSRS
jgi:protein-tyrosine phosphatase